MKIKTQRLLKKIAATLVVLLFIAVAAIGIIFQFVLTPERITPKIVNALNEQLNARVDLEAVELTFFKTFPSFKLELSTGQIVEKIDSISNTTQSPDTLISFEKALISVNPLALMRNKFSVNKFEFIDPTILVKVDDSGAMNWDIFPQSANDSIGQQEESDQIDEEKKAGAFDTDIQLKNIRIINGQLTFDDRYVDNHLIMKGFHLDLDASYSQENILLDVTSGARSFTFRKNDQTLSQDVSIVIDTDFHIDRQSRRINIQNASVDINEVSFIASGRLIPNREKREMDVDLNLDLEIPTLQTLVDLIPEGIIEEKSNFLVDGDVTMAVRLHGLYSKGIFPNIKAQMKVAEGSLYYQKIGQGIDELEMDAQFVLPADKEKPAFMNLNNLKVQGLGTKLQVQGKIDKINKAPLIDVNLKGELDLNTLQKTFPFNKDLYMSGAATLDLQATLPVKAIKNEDYGKISTLGSLDLHKLQFKNQTDSISIQIDSLSMLTAQEQNSTFLSDTPGTAIGGRLKLRGFEYARKEATNASIAQLEARFATSSAKQDSIVSHVKSYLLISKADMKSGDSLQARIQFLEGTFDIEPQKVDPKNPQLHSTFKVDSTGLRIKDRFVGISTGNYELSAFKRGKKWPMTGQIQFDKMMGYTPEFPLRIVMPKTTVKFEPGLIALDHATIRFGNSDLNATGKVYDIGDAFLGIKDFKGELKVYSQLIDLNEIITAIIKGGGHRAVAEQNKAATSPQESTTNEPGSFVVPDNLDLKLETDFEKVRFKRFDLENVKGLITIRDQQVNLANLGMVTMAAKMATSVNYQATEKDPPQLDFDFSLQEIDLAKLTDMMPIVDSLLPMADSFEGQVNFRMKGATKMDDQMDMLATSINAIARIEGEDLVILDGKTFQKISKMLFFKNKDKNKIDKLEFAMIFKDEFIQVYPSVLTIDRYKIALGGQHGLDMNYDYHLSILKSPVPFKLGIDIKGEDDDLDIKLAKARYKHLFSEKERQRKKADSTLIIQKQLIIDQLPFVKEFNASAGQTGKN